MSLNYNKLLGKFPKLPIMLDDNFSSLAYNKSISEFLDLRIKNVLNTIGNKKHSNLVYLELTKNGFKYNIEELKKEACKYFGIEYDNNLLASINLLSRGVITSNNLENCSNEIKEVYERIIEEDSKVSGYYDLFFKNDNQGKEKLYKKILLGTYKTNEQIDIVRKKVSALQNLCQEKEIAVDEDALNEEKIQFYLAYNVVFDYLKQKSNQLDDYSKEIFREYLKNYIIENADSFNNYRGVDQEKIKEIINYLNTGVIINGSDDLNSMENEVLIRNYNYNFFECDYSISKDTFHEICDRCLDNNENEEKLKELLRRKKSYYDSLGYRELLVGKESFDGYIGFKLWDGIIVLDKLYDSNKLNKIACDEAIYIAENEEAFYELTTSSKPSAINSILSGEIDADRRYHRGDFEKRVNKSIENIRNKNNKVLTLSL